MDCFIMNRLDSAQSSEITSIIAGMKKIILAAIGSSTLWLNKCSSFFMMTTWNCREKYVYCYYDNNIPQYKICLQPRKKSWNPKGNIHVWMTGNSLFVLFLFQLKRDFLSRALLESWWQLSVKFASYFIEFLNIFVYLLCLHIVLGIYNIGSSFQKEKR